MQKGNLIQHWVPVVNAQSSFSGLTPHAVQYPEEIAKCSKMFSPELFRTYSAEITCFRSNLPRHRTSSIIIISHSRIKIKYFLKKICRNFKIFILKLCIVCTKFYFIDKKGFSSALICDIIFSYAMQ